MSRQTSLFDMHVAAGGKMVDFAGWQMPVNYGSQIAEHEAVRSNAGMFDVSHMTIIDVSGEAALAFLRMVVANDVARLQPWQALYGALLNPQGGVIDDLIVYRTPDGYRCVVNASTRDKVLAWFAQHAMPGMEFVEQQLSMIAVQGPRAISICETVMATPLQELPGFAACLAERNDAWMIGRTGYTGEDGVEVMLPHADAPELWQALQAAGVAPAGLGARDTLRLEAGLNLYGQDLDEQTSPLASNIGWTIAWEPAGRDFIGRSAIEPQRGASPMKLTGLVMREKGVLRHGQSVFTEAGEGIVTSGSFSPTLQFSIALARVPKGAKGVAEVDIRGKRKRVEIVKPPFVKQGRKLVQ